MCLGAWTSAAEPVALVELGVDGYKEIGTAFRYYLDWRYKTFAGYLAVMAALAYGFWIVTRGTTPTVRSGSGPDVFVVLAAAVLSIAFWIIDFRNRDLFYGCQDAGRYYETHGRPILYILLDLIPRIKKEWPVVDDVANVQNPAVPNPEAARGKNSRWSRFCMRLIRIASQSTAIDLTIGSVVAASCAFFVLKALRTWCSPAQTPTGHDWWRLLAAGIAVVLLCCWLRLSNDLGCRAAEIRRAAFCRAIKIKM